MCGTDKVYNYKLILYQFHKTKLFTKLKIHNLHNYLIIIKS